MIEILKLVFCGIGLVISLCLIAPFVIIELLRLLISGELRRRYDFIPEPKDLIAGWTDEKEV